MSPIIELIHPTKDVAPTPLPRRFSFAQPWSLDPRLVVAVLGALLYHGVLSIFGTYRNTYTPVERLEGTKFRGVPGLGSRQQFLNIPDKYNLKYIFSNDQFYDPLLFFYGWHKIQLLGNGIVVWERADITLTCYASTPHIQPPATWSGRSTTLTAYPFLSLTPPGSAPPKPTWVSCVRMARGNRLRSSSPPAPHSICHRFPAGIVGPNPSGA